MRFPTSHAKRWGWGTCTTVFSLGRFLANCKGVPLAYPCSHTCLMNTLINRIPEDFNAKLIKRDFGDNAIIRTNNLKRIISASQSFLNSVNVRFAVFKRVDPQVVANTADEPLIELLLQAVLGVSVQCPRNEEYIGLIMQLPEDCQNHLMVIINSVLYPTGENAQAASHSTMVRAAADEADQALEEASVL
jgi:hypothetical protein